MIVRVAFSALGLTAPYYARRMECLTRRRHEDVASLVSSNGLLFVHIPKCGGTSLWKSLPIVQPRDAHIPARTWRRLLGPQFDQLSVFSVVRNPWDRLVSAFHYLKTTTAPDDRKFADKFLAPIDDFEDFCARLHDDFWYSHNVLSFRHFHPQVLYLNDGRKRRLVPSLLRIENLEDDLSEFIRHAGLPADFTLAHENKSTRADYRRYYDDRSAELVGRLYAEDIAELGYTFDGPVP